jgi:hypothetical protein
VDNEVATYSRTLHKFNVACHFEKYDKMKIYFLVIFSLLVISGRNQSTKNDKFGRADLIPTTTTENDTMRESKLLLDTLTIEGSNFIVFQSYPGRDTSCNLTIIDRKKDTVYIHRNYATNGFELEDFDNDGILDIRLYQLSNIGGISELIMFNKTSKSFQEILNFTDFADPKKIDNSVFWYSYQRAGCADVNWESKLFKIVDFRAIEVGEINGIFCEHEPNKGIFIYRTLGKQKTQIHSENKWPEKFRDRWVYIEDYWTKNYKKFE